MTTERFEYAVALLMAAGALWAFGRALAHEALTGITRLHERWLARHLEQASRDRIAGRRDPRDID